MMVKMKFCEARKEPQNKDYKGSSSEKMCQWPGWDIEKVCHDTIAVRFMKESTNVWGVPDKTPVFSTTIDLNTKAHRLCTRTVESSWPRHFYIHATLARFQMHFQVNWNLASDPFLTVKVYWCKWQKKKKLIENCPTLPWINHYT